jgi:hypothetical protein
MVLLQLFSIIDENQGLEKLNFQKKMEGGGGNFENFKNRYKQFQKKKNLLPTLVFINLLL